MLQQALRTTADAAGALLNPAGPPKTHSQGKSFGRTKAGCDPGHQRPAKRHKQVLVNIIYGLRPLHRPQGVADIQKQLDQ